MMHSQRRRSHTAVHDEIMHFFVSFSYSTKQNKNECILCNGSKYVIQFSEVVFTFRFLRKLKWKRGIICTVRITYVSD